MFSYQQVSNELKILMCSFFVSFAVKKDLSLSKIEHAKLL